MESDTMAGCSLLTNKTARSRAAILQGVEAVLAGDFAALDSILIGE